MSIQDDSGISFDVCHEQQNFRLLELPPALLKTITAGPPPSLFLKSTVSGAKTGLNSTNHAVLCTHDTTFCIRQVQSSNSVFLLQPCEIVPQGFTAGVSAIAQCTATLELIASSNPGTSVLRQILPVYKGTLTELDDEAVSESLPNADEPANKQGYLDSSPLSKLEFEATWEQMCAFELNGQAYLPEPALLVAAWSTIMSTALENSIDIDQEISITDLTALVQQDCNMISLIEAILNRISPKNKVLEDGWAMISRDECVLWIGLVLLELRSQSNEGSVMESSFLREWEQQLPEAWREHAKINVLKGMYSQPARGRLTFNNGTSKANSLDSSAMANASGKRPGKWHEKFKNTGH